MTIQWFPGHMHRARKQIEAAMPRIDVVIEVLDARLPRSSENPMLGELRGAKPCVKVLSKADLADPAVTAEWREVFDASEGVLAEPLSCHARGEVRKLPATCGKLAPGRGTLLKPIRVLVAGIPNVGKSTLINTLRGKRIAKVGDVPALTRGQQRVELREGFVVSDTPGVLWPKLDDQVGAQRLAASGAIRDSAMDYPSIALFAAEFLRDRYPHLLAERYDMESVPEAPIDILDEIARRRGCIMRGAEVDYQKTAEVLLRDMRSGRLGRVSLERPSDFS